MPKNKQPHVSDHAVLRYLERHYNFDVEGIRKEILTPERIASIKAGATSISVNNIKFIIDNNTVITALNGKKQLNKRAVR